MYFGGKLVWAHAKLTLISDTTAADKMGSWDFPVEAGELFLLLVFDVSCFLPNGRRIMPANFPDFLLRLQASN